jgi:antitoxin component YwqK of YwqJK toxin-antitoxin module
LEWKDGLLNGSFEMFYENGYHKISAEFKDGQLQGEYSFYDENENNV